MDFKFIYAYKDQIIKDLQYIHDRAIHPERKRKLIEAIKTIKLEVGLYADTYTEATICANQ